MYRFNYSLQLEQLSGNHSGNCLHVVNVQSKTESNIKHMLVLECHGTKSPFNP